MSGRGSIALGPDMGQRVSSEEAMSALAVLPAPQVVVESETRLASVVTRHFALVWRSLVRFGVAERAADDAAQQVFMTFAERAGAVGPDREAPFLIAVAARVAANARRKVERSREVLSDQMELTADDRTPEALLEQKQRLQELERVLESLPFEQRTVFVLFELEGWSLPEIAEALVIPLGTATSRLRRARDKFESWVSTRSSSGGEP
jgi:RNA polymerase sigma-70 factor (ECF subfamily)